MKVAYNIAAQEYWNNSKMQARNKGKLSNDSLKFEERKKVQEKYMEVFEKIIRETI